MMIPEVKHGLKIVLFHSLKISMAMLAALFVAIATSGAQLGPAVAVPLPRAEQKKPEALTVTVKPQKSQVRVREQFAVRLRVVNISRTPQSFQVMNCSWDEHWQSSNKQVSWVGWNCSKNFAVTETLKPGQAYEKTLSMLVLAGGRKGKVSFKMGFTPIGSKRTYWSKEVTVQLSDSAERAHLIAGQSRHQSSK